MSENPTKKITVSAIISKAIRQMKSVLTFAPEFEDKLEKQVRQLGIGGNFLRSAIMGFSSPMIFIAVYSQLTPLMRNTESALIVVFGVIVSALCSDDDIIAWIHNHYGTILTIDCLLMAIANYFVLHNPNIRVIIMASVDTVIMTLWMTGYNSTFNNTLSNDDLTKWDLVLHNANQLGYLLGTILFFITEFVGLHLALYMVCITQVIAIVLDACCDNIVHRRLYKLIKTKH